MVKYSLDLVSANWFNCKANVIYSNFDRAPESNLDILKNCIVNASLAIDVDSFDVVKSNTLVNYAT